MPSTYFPARLTLAISLVAIGLGSCRGVSDQAHRLYIDQPLPSKDQAEVLILFTKPDRPFTVIADLQARNASPEYMQGKAAEIGADAVLCAYLGGQRNYSDEWADVDTSKTYRRIAGTAIVFTDN